MINSRDELKKLLMAAYEKGWRGSLELKESAVDEMVEKHFPTGEPQDIQLQLDFPADVMIAASPTDGTDNIAIDSNSWIVGSAGSGLLAEMSPDQIVAEFGLEERPDINVSPSDRRTWGEINPGDSIRVSDR